MKKGSLEIVVLFFVFDFKILKDCHTNFTPDLGFGSTGIGLGTTYFF